MAREQNWRVWGIDERLYIIIGAPHANREGHGSISICALASSNLKEPLCEFIRGRVLTKTHISFEMEDAKLGPEARSAKCSTHYLLPGSMGHHRQGLPKVSSKEHGYSSKISIYVQKI